MFPILPARYNQIMKDIDQLQAEAELFLEVESVLGTEPACEMPGHPSPTPWGHIDAPATYLIVADCGLSKYACDGVVNYIRAHGGVRCVCKRGLHPTSKLRIVPIKDV